MTKPRSKPPTIILDNSCGDAQNFLEDQVFVGLLAKLIEAANRLYAEDGVDGLSLKLGLRPHANLLWRMVVDAEVRLRGATLANVVVATWSSGQVRIYENRARCEEVAATEATFLAIDFYKILQKRAKALGSRRK